MQTFYSYLDKIRINYGIDKCIDAFQQAYKKSRKSAIVLLNDRRIKFPCLFILLPQIESLNLYNDLNPRNITVLGIINQIIKPQDLSNDMLSDKNETVYSALKWILETGSSDDGLNDEYEEILDIAVSALINIYKDKSVLPIVADMIFKRNKKGHCIHDLVWAFFQIRDPYALRLIAEYIRSSDKEDVKLACKLLNIDDNQIYESYLQWLEENDPYLYFTEESLQYSGKPVLFKVDSERKHTRKVNETEDFL